MSAFAYVMLLGLCSALFGQAFSSTSAERQAVVDALLASGPLNLVRPDGVESNSPVVVNISFYLTRITDLTYEPEMSNGRMDSVGYLLMTWVDPRLAFRPGNLSGIRMETSKIWTPDVELYTAFTPGLQMLNRKDLAVVSPNGLVVWIPQVAASSVCTNSGTLSCVLSFGSWTYDASQIDLRPSSSEVDLSDYYYNNYWRLTSTSVNLHTKYYTCCPEPYATVDFVIEVERGQ